MTNTDITTVRPSDNARRTTWATFATDHGVTVTDDMGRNDIVAAYNDHVAAAAAAANVPTGVVIVTDVSARDIIGTHHPRYVNPDDMTVVRGAWGTNATLDVTDPSRGVGRGYVRPFVVADANAHGIYVDDDGVSRIVCRNGAACVGTHDRDDRGGMPITAFPTLSRPTADGRNRADRCRACRDHA